MQSNVSIEVSAPAGTKPVSVSGSSKKTLKIISVVSLVIFIGWLIGTGVTYGDHTDEVQKVVEKTFHIFIASAVTGIVAYALVFFEARKEETNNQLIYAIIVLLLGVIGLHIACAVTGGKQYNQYNGIHIKTTLLS